MRWCDAYVRSTIEGRRRQRRRVGADPKSIGVNPGPARPSADAHLNPRSVGDNWWLDHDQSYTVGGCDHCHRRVEPPRLATGEAGRGSSATLTHGLCDGKEAGVQPSTMALDHLAEEAR